MQVCGYKCRGGGIQGTYSTSLYSTHCMCLLRGWDDSYLDELLDGLVDAFLDEAGGDG